MWVEYLSRSALVAVSFYPLCFTNTPSNAPVIRIILRRRLMEKRTETRVRYIWKDNSLFPPNTEFVYSDICDESGLDYAAGDKLLMEDCIAWVETRTVVETDWVTEVEPELDQEALENEMVGGWHNPWSPTCIKRLPSEPSNNRALCFICDFRNVRNYENKKERERQHDLKAYARKIGLPDLEPKT